MADKRPTHPYIIIPQTHIHTHNDYNDNDLQQQQMIQLLVKHSEWDLAVIRSVASLATEIKV